MLVDAKGESEVKDAHDDGTMRGSEENQRIEPTTGLGFPFAGASTPRSCNSCSLAAPTTNAPVAIGNNSSMREKTYAHESRQLLTELRKA